MNVRAGKAKDGAFCKQKLNTKKKPKCTLLYKLFVITLCYYVYIYKRHCLL